MIVLISLLLLAFLIGIWMGLSFYRRTTTKATVNGVVTRFTVRRR